LLDDRIVLALLEARVDPGQRFTSTAAPGSPPVALRAPSSEPGATPLPSLLFNIAHSVFQTRFNPKSVSKKIGAGAPMPSMMGGACFALLQYVGHARPE
jgi:hypothetical protein